ncbi:MAG: CPBP family intramembrane metalloprotease [Clostridia bacterium]|nr:CPBP family intramembrane metalloprotease [Clostridia bacterium]
MNNYDQNIPYAPAFPPQPAAPDAGMKNAADMKSAYNRTGLSVLILYGIISAVSTVLIVGEIIGFAFSDLLDVFMKSVDGGEPALLPALRDLFEGSLMDWYAFLSILATGIGIGASIPLMRKVLRYRNRIPIPKKRLSVPAFLAVIMTAYGLWGVGVYLGNFMELLGYPTPDLYSFGDGFSFQWAVMTLYAVVGAPILEELVFRKTLLDVLHPHGETAAALVSALLFGLIHGNSGQFFLAFLLGLLFAGVYQRTGKIAYTMILHFIINMTATVPELITAAGADGETVSEIFMMFVLPALTVAGLIVFLITYRRNADWFRLTLPAFRGANRAMFGNPGMLIAAIGGTVLAAGTDFVLIIRSAKEYESAVPLLGLLATLLMIGVVVLVCTLGGRKYREPDPGREDVSAPTFS